MFPITFEIITNKFFKFNYSYTRNQLYEKSVFISIISRRISWEHSGLPRNAIKAATRLAL